MRNMAVLHSPAFSYPLPVLVRVLSNLLIFKGKILYYNKDEENSRKNLISCINFQILTECPIFAYIKIRNRMSDSKYISIKGAKVNNLKNIDVDIPRNKLVVITGLSGSGKSSLAFDTLYAEGQRRYVESLSSYARQFLGRMGKPECDFIKGIPPAIAIEQKVISRNPRSTVGTSTEIYEYLRLLFARIGKTYSPVSGELVKKDSPEDIVNCMLSYPKGTKYTVLTLLFHVTDVRIRNSWTWT